MFTIEIEIKEGFNIGKGYKVQFVPLILLLLGVLDSTFLPYCF